MTHVSRTARRASALAAVAAMLALTGCASTATNPQDPLEGYNRAVFSLNDAVDRTVLKPTATVYKDYTPGPVQTGVNNFFGNLSDAWSGVNNLLQGKGQAGMGDLTRFAFNSTFGLLGVLDIASEAGIPKHNEDFGQTLGVWGVPSGPYLMLPLLGPSTVRDTAALPADIGADIWKYKQPDNWRNIGNAVRVVDKRATLLDATSLLEDAALDRYDFIRDGYMQRRQSQVYDGNPPQAAEDKDADANSQVVPQPVSSEKQ
ncbi:VacJ family lipoprotein [Massilia sp. AB1]|uniref:MlaA family lipoprotein n=1 Tax=Massilia sp. AB1 TaxID=2823371 RepID=UPI001B81C66D|nr:VacJ family lipoprotein [Massilia sp. AB1]MBQ5938684.1 VacJ family lipoprotein [Massilia sp. AB1]